MPCTAPTTHDHSYLPSFNPKRLQKKAFEYGGVVRRNIVHGKFVDADDYCLRDEKRVELVSVPDAQTKQQKFRTYLQQWKDETAGMSSLTDITGNLNYLLIISLGDDIVPEILKELQNQPLPLFLALRVLTKEKTVGSNRPGDFKRMARDWIKWGKEHNKL